MIPNSFEGKGHMYVHDLSCNKMHQTYTITNCHFYQNQCMKHVVKKGKEKQGKEHAFLIPILRGLWVKV